MSIWTTYNQPTDPPAGGVGQVHWYVKGGAAFIRLDDGTIVALGGGGSSPPFSHATDLTAGTLVWTASGHTGTASRVAAFDGGGAASYLQVGVDLQAHDADLDALAALASTGLAVRSAADTWTTRQLQQPAEGLTIANPAGVAGNPTFALANDLAALEALGSVGLSARVGVDTWATRSIAAPPDGITITNAAGVAGNPTLALANDLAAVEGLAGVGFGARIGTDSWAIRSITAPADGLAVSNGDGVAGDPEISAANDLAAVEALTTSGIAVRAGLDTWATRSITAPADGLSVTNGDGVAGDPEIAPSDDLAALEALAATGIAVRSGASTWILRAITGTTNRISVSNGDGVAGDPAIDIGPDVFLRDGSVAATGSFNLGNFDLQAVRTSTFQAELDNGNSGAAATITWGNAQKQRITLTDAATLTFNDPPGPCNLVLVVIQDATGNRTITWPGSVLWPNGNPVNLTNAGNAIDIVSLYFDGTSYYGVGSTNFQ